MTATAPLATAPAPPEPAHPTPAGWLLWAWRTLTSMRTALLLLLLLALAAVPGSVIPQRQVDPLAVRLWQEQNPQLTPLYEQLGLFAVYRSVWFSAIYLLLMTSLVGCIVPRLRLHVRALAAPPPPAPRRLERLPVHESFEVADAPEAVAERARLLLRRRRFRVRPAEEDAPATVSAQRGYLREAGNLCFHVSVVLVLLGYAYGSLFGFTGGVIVVSGQGFSNNRAQYDEFVPGARFDASSMTPFSFILEDFRASFVTSGPQAGTPSRFAADLAYRSRPGAPPRRTTITVNEPLDIDGTSVFLVGHGYAPEVTVRDGKGAVVYSGPTVFLPEDGSFRSFGVIKAPDARPQQLGFEGLFLPTYGFTMARGPFSQFPDLLAPAMTLTAYRGDLGLDSGTPQSVYVLRKEGVEQLRGRDGRPFRVDVAPGGTVRLPDGAGSLTFDGVRRWAKFQIGYTPAEGFTLAAGVLGLVGLLGSLFVRPRRVWVRVHGAGPTCRVELAGLDRMSGGRLAQELATIRAQLEKETS